MRENKYQAQVIEYLNSQDYCVAVPYTPGTNGVKGTPDIIGCYRGFSFVIECKIAPNTPDEKQDYELKRWAMRGAIALVATHPQNTPKEVFEQLQNVCDARSTAILMKAMELYAQKVSDSSDPIQ